MKITFLGTGTSQGIPVIACNCEVCKSDSPKDNRLRTSILVETNQASIAVDAGPDFRQQMLREQVQKLDAVLMTHEHKDHIAGLDDVRAFNFKQRKDMHVFADENTQKAIQRDFYYAFSEFKYPGVPRIELHTIKGEQAIEVEGLEIMPIEVLHYKLPVLGFRFGPFTYITDANYISESSKELIRGSEVLVLNALKKEEHISHFSISQAVALAQELEIPQTYLTHLSHQAGLAADIEKELPKGVNLAYDGLKLNF